MIWNRFFVLFKNMPMAYKAYKAGFRYTTLQVGGIGGGVGRKNIVGPISFDDNDAKMLDEMFQDGLEAYFQRYRIIKRYPGLM